MKLQKDLRAFIESLNAAEVKYLIVGGYAVAYHGLVRHTNDIDILVEPSPDNAARVCRAMDLFGFGGLGLTPADFVTPDRIIQIGYPPHRVDILTSIEAVSFEEAWAAGVRDTLDELPTTFLSRELLIRNKRATGRSKDAADADNLP